MADKTNMMIEFEMFYAEKGLEFYIRIPYSERAWQGVMSLRRARNIKLVQKAA